MRDLLEIRDEIDELDSQIVALYEKRMQLTSDVAEYKINTGFPHSIVPSSIPANRYLIRRGKIPNLPR